MTQYGQIFSRVLFPRLMVPNPMDLRILGEHLV